MTGWVGARTLSDGRLVELPARHSLDFGLTAAFLGRTGAAARFLAERGVPGRPARFLPGRTLVIVAYQEFSDSPAGPYRQVSVSLPVHLPAGPGVSPRVGAPVLLPLLTQSLWNTEKVFRNLHFYVAEIPVSEAAAVPYSSEIWGEPAWRAEVAVERLAGPRGCRHWAVTVSEAGSLFLSVRTAGGALRLTERRGYRLVGLAASGVLTDVMRVESPGRLSLGLIRAGLSLGAGPRTATLREILGDRPACIQVLEHHGGTVTFGGPHPWGEATPTPVGKGVPPGGL
jgi:hypothetical protein